MPIHAEPDAPGPARAANGRTATGTAASFRQGHSGSPYDWLLGAGGLAYLLAVAVLRWRG